VREGREWKKGGELDIGEEELSVRLHPVPALLKLQGHCVKNVPIK